MKTIGLVGGTGWISSAEYYKLINEETNRRLGGLEFSKCILYSFNYSEINKLNKKNDHEIIGNMVVDTASKLTTAGADCILLCANTLHMYADKLKSKIHVPLIHIAEATAKEINNTGLSKVALLGTKYTMEMDFYKSKLGNVSIETVVPGSEERQFIHDSIFEELLKQKFLESTKSRYLSIIDKLHEQGAEGVILGCTEIPFLITEEDLDLPLFNTTEIHAKAAVEFALG